VTETAILETPAEAEGKSFSRPPLWWAVIQIVALAFHVPLSVLAGGVGATMDPGISVLISLVISVLGILIWLALSATLSRPWEGLMVTSALLVGFWHWSASETSGNLLRIVWVALLVAGAARFAGSQRFRIATFAVAVTLGLTPLLVVATRAYASEPVVASSFDGFPGNPERKPDIYFLLLDAYGNSDVLRDIYGFDNEPFLSDLERRGFAVSRSATADYTYTHASIPSILNMEYLPRVSLSQDAQSLASLTDAIAGNNRVVSWLKELGYTYIHGETSDGTNDCGPQVDICLPSPYWDFTTEYLLGRTPVGPLLFPSNGSPHTAFNAARIKQMSRWQEDSDAESEGPVFAFIHLLLPHPPFALDSNCDVRLDSDLSGRLSERGLSAEVVSVRRAGYIEQVECANQVVTQFIDQLDPDSMVILTGDHGPESFGQLTIDGSEWNATELYERAGVLAAIRGPTGCQVALPEDHHLVNTIRIAMSCLTSSSLPLLPHLGTS
jgi:hypothetical protein